LCPVQISNDFQVLVFMIIGEVEQIHLQHQTILLS
jgi:hypothetical protein